MYRITQHPIIDITETEEVTFQYNGQTVHGQKGHTIAAALHQAGFPIHSHSLDGRKRSLECGIGKCGACEMLVDGQVRRICITLVDGVKEVCEITKDSHNPKAAVAKNDNTVKIYKTTVAIIGAGPAGLACRRQLNDMGIDNLLIDNNSRVGGQFNMQTHQFFFFEHQHQLGGMRGFDIAKHLVGDNEDNILLNNTVWDVLEGRRIALKNIVTGEIGFVDAEYMVVATGATPYMPTFENDDLPGVYTAGVFQKMMNQEYTLLGKRILTVGAGNIGYLTSYQAMQAGAEIRAIIEYMDHEGGFPVQANRVRRLGIPILTSRTLLKAIPNSEGNGIRGAVIGKVVDGRYVPGTEETIEDIDMINICTGLISDDRLINKSRDVFGLKAFAAGDATRIGEGTSAVLQGRKVAYEIVQSMGRKIDYNQYLDISKQHIESQQHPIAVRQTPLLPTPERMKMKPFVVQDCLYGFACNPCTFACPQGAISKLATNTAPTVDYDRCIGCMKCVSHCPGLAIFGFDSNKQLCYLPIEHTLSDHAEVYLVDNQGSPIGEGIVQRIILNANKTNVAVVAVSNDRWKEMHTLTDVRGLIEKDHYPEPLHTRFVGHEAHEEEPQYVCHCEDVELSTILSMIGDRKYISIDELKHTTRLGMGPCRGRRCVPRVKQLLAAHGIELTGMITPRASMANYITLGDAYNPNTRETFVFPKGKQQPSEEVEVFVAGGGIAGSSLFRYFCETGHNTVMVNYDRGATWRCIGGGRPAFSNPDIADIATHNHEIFRQIQQHTNINYKPTRYVNLVHDDATYRSLDASRAWSDAYMIDRNQFRDEISPLWDDRRDTYSHALITRGCWQATPGLTVDYLRKVGTQHGGRYYEDTELLQVQRNGDKYHIVVRHHEGTYKEYIASHFVNALGWGAERFTDALGIDTALTPVKHQAFITRRLPLMGKDGDSLDMIIDRRHYKGFSAVYGQQFAHTGQIIGCASPDSDGYEARQPLKYNSKEFLEIIGEMFSEWIPDLSEVSFLSVWAGWYTEPRYIVDPAKGLLVGLRGHGFMLAQYLAKLYVDVYNGKEVPSYMNDLALSGKGLSENAFK
ncbi:MAG: FAD-dependent oxidoreductase [Bacteroidales bacterium]|nr:FAD-dependent oxidoreductase [Bacteroidales bacterium]